jgi:hypothetical protein
LSVVVVISIFFTVTQALLFQIYFNILNIIKRNQ